MATQVSLNDGAVASAGALAIQTNGNTQAVSISTGQVATLAQNPILTSGTANGVAYLNGSKVLTTGSGLVFDSSGNLGLGVTPSAFLSTWKVFQIGYTGSLATQTATNIISLDSNRYQNTSNQSIYIQNGYASSYYQYLGQHVWQTAASGTAGNAITFTQAMTLDASGNLGIGTTSPSARLSVIAASANSTAATIGGIEYGGSKRGLTIKTFNSAGGDDCGVEFNAANGLGGYGAFKFAANTTTLATLDASGNLLVGTTGLPVANGRISSASASTSVTAGRFYCSAGDAYPSLAFDKSSTTNTTSQIFAIFTINNQSTGSGQINANGASQAAFGSFSDARLKENIVDLPPQLDNIMALRPVEFDYIESEGGGHQINFIAQEFEEVYPDAIGERADGMKTLTGWGKTEARLVKALQEMKAIIDTQASTITQLQADVAALKGA